MSEYQFIHFLAVDRPLDEKQLDFMRKQSTRAKITRWEFTNEYHFGDFHGNALEMLRRGYDLHLHYANFGVRRLMIRLPAGLPCDRKLFKAMQSNEGAEWHADKKGPGGILEISPSGDADSFDEIYNPGPVLHKLAPLREMLLAGDLRPLYIAWLACAGEPEAMEPPVPAGLADLPPALKAMARFYDIGRDMIVAAAKNSPPLPKEKADDALKTWIARQSPDALRELLEKILAGDAVGIRTETLARIREGTPTTGWPMAEPTRTLGQLRELAEKRHHRRVAREEEAATAARTKRLEEIAADPRSLIANVEKLVKTRSVDDYEKAAKELADLREALGPEAGPARARAVAEKLRKQNPRLHRLIGALRKQGLLK